MVQLSDDDLIFEEELVRNPHNIQVWIEYITSKPLLRARIPLFERALQSLPGSYKIWKKYLDELSQFVKHKAITDPMYNVVNAIFERALVFMHKMPVIWMEYCKFLTKQKLITKTRRTFDRALQSLPVTQHEKIWNIYIDFVVSSNVRQTAVTVYRRFLQFDPSNKQDFIEYLLSIQRFGDACVEMTDMITYPKFSSENGKSKHQLWMDLCELISKHAMQVQHKLDVDAILRTGLAKFSDETGRLWCALGDYYIRLGEFERARDIFEEALGKVQTVRDFSSVFDAYAQFEEAVLTANMESEEETVFDANFRLARLEHLLDRRPFILNSVRLRQEPNNVNEWHKRIDLYEQDPVKVIEVFGKAVKTVNPRKAIGKAISLWIAFAKYYEIHGMLDDARTIFSRAREVDFSKVDDLAIIYCESAELEIRHKEYKKARDLLHKAVEQPQSREFVEIQNQMRQLKAQGRIKEAASLEEESKSIVNHRLYKSYRIWSLYVDLEEAVGTLDTTKAAYDRMIDIKVASTQTILNYANLLKEKKYFEESYRAYEKGIQLFPWPHVYQIWIQYLSEFVKRFGGQKLERTRDLFEQALHNCPPKESKVIFIMYADLEEKYGLVRHAMSVYDRACAHVESESKLELFKVYIKKVEQSFGVTKSRPVYERAIQELEAEQAKEISLMYAEMETNLGEVDRARAIYSHGAQFCNPKVVVSYWKQWNDFEVTHGNEDTYRDMLRVKNTVASQYSHANYNLATDAPLVNDQLEMMVGDDQNDKIEALEQKAIMEASNANKTIIGEKRGASEGGAVETNLESMTRHAAKIKEKVGTTATENSTEETEIEVETQHVPSTVFGEGFGKKIGALERMKAAKQSS